MNRSRRPADSRCAICKNVTDLVWDHCHACGAERGYLCNDCNLPITEHIEDHWDEVVEYLDSHTCHPTLEFDLPPRIRSYARPVSRHTERVHFGQGHGDPRYYMASKIKGSVTVEQLAAILGVAAGTARDLVHGRRQKIGYMVDGTVFVTYSEALILIHERWGIQ